MAYVHIRISDELYKAVQSVLESELRTDISIFVRRILLDTLLVYGAPSTVEPVLLELGLKHEAQAGPSLILDMAKDWYLIQALGGRSFGHDKFTTRELREFGQEFVLTLEELKQRKSGATQRGRQRPK